MEKVSGPEVAIQGAHRTTRRPEAIRLTCIGSVVEAERTARPKRLIGGELHLPSSRGWQCSQVHGPFANRNQNRHRSGSGHTEDSVAARLTAVPRTGGFQRTPAYSGHGIQT